jgi:hypothetical protein
MTTFEINVPAETSSEKVMNRFHDFKKYGFQNIQDQKINLYLLASKGNKQLDLMEGWPENVTPYFIETPYSHVAQRVFHYYAEVIQPNRADWYIRLDEDSMTDIGGLDQILQERFDPNREYHLGGHINYDSQAVDRSILSVLGYDNWYRGCDTPGHEVEISITSNPAVERMCNNPDSMSYFQMRKEFAEGWGDQGMCHALRLAKVHTIHTRFMTHDPDIFNFSIFGGMRYHIHHISRDQTPKNMYFMDHFTGKKIEEINKDIFFIGKNNGGKRLIRFHDNFSICIVNPHNKNEPGDPYGLWCEKDGKIMILHEEKDEEEVAMFEKVNDNKFVWKEFTMTRIKTK